MAELSLSSRNGVTRLDLSCDRLGKIGFRAFHHVIQAFGSLDRMIEFDSFDHDDQVADHLLVGKIRQLQLFFFFGLHQQQAYRLVPIVWINDVQQ